MANTLQDVVDVFGNSENTWTWLGHCIL
jgi:hypothetical protein